MSKSLKNFISIRGALAAGTTPRQLRLFFVLFPWHAALDFSEENMEFVKAREKAFRTFFQNVDVLSREHGEGGQGPAGWDEREFQLNRAAEAAAEAVRGRLEDNVDTVGAVGALSELIREARAGAGPGVCVRGSLVPGFHLFRRGSGGGPCALLPHPR